eukprot:375527-Prymnesium_polylepis.1
MRSSCPRRSRARSAPWSSCRTAPSRSSGAPTRRAAGRTVCCSGCTTTRGRSCCVRWPPSSVGRGI